MVGIGERSADAFNSVLDHGGLGSSDHLRTCIVSPVDYSASIWTPWNHEALLASDTDYVNSALSPRNPLPLVAVSMQ